ncbi:hypothetical protein BDN72DRAFT_782197 [Pluteus cervinus]|uniref:Uncharacterized protein n=1 Tax=Pluteus cervinus TaxID=181527 RepID=A0ACD2ZY47_9AGAR|nr:hypothetical protein BDN72DRAFT_782197 [Pluteus cervinus]
MRIRRYLDFTNRPRWAKVLDGILSQNIQEKYHVRDKKSAINTFLQTWKPSMKGEGVTTPPRMIKMIKTAKKYGVTFDPTYMDQETRRQLPIWYHLGTAGGRRNENEQWAICQRQNHGIGSVGEMERYVNEPMPTSHKRRRNCACVRCKAHRDNGCENPIACKARGKKRLDDLPPRWNPSTKVEPLHH